MNHRPFIVTGEKKIRLKDYDPAFTGKFKNKEGAARKLKRCKRELQAIQEILFAQNTYGLLVILQGMDTAGKDSTVKYVMSGVNPMGCQVFSFRVPSAEELNHDYLWRNMKALPERGRIGIFNRSYYEELLVVRVHPELLEKQKIPPEIKYEGNIWERRFEEIRNFEKYLVNNGIVVLKFFLQLSKEEQKERFFERITRPEKNWKFSINDVRERIYWKDYVRIYEDMINNTATTCAPWYIVPADKKWFTRAVVADIIIAKLRSLNLQYPIMSQEEHKKNLESLKSELESEKD